MLNETLYNETQAVLFVVFGPPHKKSKIIPVQSQCLSRGLWRETNHCPYKHYKSKWRKKIKKEENTANKCTAKPQTEVRVWAYVSVSRTHLSTGNFTTPCWVCNLNVGVCIHHSQQWSLPPSYLSATAASPTGGVGGWGSLRWKKNTTYQISSERLFSLYRKPLKRVIVQPDKVHTRAGSFYSRIC